MNKIETLIETYKEYLVVRANIFIMLNGVTSFIMPLSKKISD